MVASPSDGSWGWFPTFFETIGKRGSEKKSLKQKHNSIFKRMATSKEKFRAWQSWVNKMMVIIAIDMTLIVAVLLVMLWKTT